MTDAPKDDDAYNTLVEIGYGTQALEVKALMETRDDHRALMRAAHALCLEPQQVTDGIDGAAWRELWALCKDYTEE